MLVVCELFFVHATRVRFRSLLLHLAAQERLVLLVDVVDLPRKPLLLQLVVLLVSGPDDCLLVV